MLKFNAPITTDVLVVGGGIGGLCAAIASAREGAKTLVAEKSDTRRSGSGATGNDHFACYYPKQHGEDIGVILKELRQSLVGAYHDEKLSLRFLEESLHVADLWHEWGINMKPFGDDYEFMGHAYPGRPRIWLKYDGHNQKQVLTRQARKEGVEILNHHPVADLIVANGEIAGALALDISRDEPSFTVIRAKKVILATGTANRLYPAAGSPGWPFNTAFCPACAGAAQAQGWRIGAKMVNMEMPNRHAGPKFFARAGKSTWIGVYRYPDGRLLGPFVDKATRYVGDITCDVWNSAYTDVLLNGSGPAYIDCTQTGAEDLAFMRRAMASEGLTGLVNYMDEQGIDPARHAMEFGQFEPQLMGHGVQIDINGETSIPGLYAAGDMVGNFRSDISGAAVWGWMEAERPYTAGSAVKRRQNVRRHASLSPRRRRKRMPGLRNAWPITVPSMSAPPGTAGRKSTGAFSRSCPIMPMSARTMSARRTCSMPDSSTLPTCARWPGRRWPRPTPILSCAPLKPLTSWTAAKSSCMPPASAGKRAACTSAPTSRSPIRC